MPALSPTTRVLTTTAVIGAVLLSGTPAMADNVIGGGSQNPPPKVSGDAGPDGTLSAGVVVFDRSKNGSGPKAGPVTSATTWTPPACYYAPKYTPEQLQKYLEPIWEAGSTGHEWDLSQRKRYVEGEPYKDFNKEKAGEGYWWDSYVTPAFSLLKSL